MAHAGVEIPGVPLKRLGGSEVRLGADVIAAFKTRLRGALVKPGEAGYDESRALWNAMIDRRPGLVVKGSGTADVAEAVRFAREHGLLLSVKGGGHNIAGLAVCDGGLMLDLSPMKGVFVDPKTRVARAQAGCLLGDLDRETQAHGLAAVLGFVSATGLAGLTVGGGFGYLTRRCGWTADNVVSLEVVTAEGRIVRASADENADLFWGLRGGGGNLGIVASFEYKLHQLGPEVVAGAIAWRAEDAAGVCKFYREFTAKAPRELTCVLGLRIAPPAPWLPKEIHGKPIVAMFVCHTGRPEDGEKLVAPIKAFGKPVADIVVRRPYAQMQSLLDATQPKGRRYYWKSEYLPGAEPDMLASIVKALATIPSPHSALFLFHLGGALNELPEGHSPAGNRDAKFVLNIASQWEAPADDAKHIAWTRDTWQACRRFSTGGVYVNFLTADEGQERTQAAYGGKNFARLAELKRKWDPENLFRHNKNVPPQPAASRAERGSR